MPPSDFPDVDGDAEVAGVVGVNRKVVRRVEDGPPQAGDATEASDPGPFVGLEDAVRRYGVRSTDLRRHLRRGEIVGAHKVSDPRADQWRRLPVAALESLGYRAVDPSPEPSVAAPPSGPPARVPAPRPAPSTPVGSPDAGNLVATSSG